MYLSVCGENIIYVRMWGIIRQNVMSHNRNGQELTSLSLIFELLKPPPDVTTPPCVDEQTISPTPEH